MGLRDRGFVLDYYIPLFSGVDGAKRARFRTRFPFSIYAPYITGGGTGTPGGICGGDGGCDDPPDFSIQTPVITSPTIGSNLGVSVCDTITSSAFASDNGQTHVASRWMIEVMNTEFEPGGPISCTQYRLHPDSDGAAMPFRDTIAQALRDYEILKGWDTNSAFIGTNDYRGAGCFTGGPQTVPGIVQGSPICGRVGGSTFSAGAGTTTYGTRTGVYCTGAGDLVPTTGTGIYAYDSGPDVSHLTSLPIPDAGLAPEGAYRVVVRYKGSNGGWSDWSIGQVFTLGVCTDC